MDPRRPSSQKPAARAQAPTGRKTKQEPTCVLLTREAPRGGRLEVQGNQLEAAALVRIDGHFTRIIERTKDTIAVQIPRESNGGKVTLQAARRTLTCGRLKIIGLN